MISRTLIAVLATAITLGAIGAQSAEERANAVQEFKRFFRKFKEVNEKVEAVRTLEGMESEAACRELVKLLDHKMPEVARAAGAVLATYTEPKTFAPFVAELPEMKDQVQRARLIKVFGEAGLRDAMPVITSVVLEDKKASAEVRYEAARAAARIGSVTTSAPMLEKLIGDRDALVRLAAADSVGKLRIKPLGSRLIPLLDDSAWQVQTAAVGAIASVRDPGAVEPLIALMQKGGRLEEECADALFSITGYDFGTDAAEWTKIWERLKAIEGWRIPTDEELAKKAAARKRYDALYGKRDKQPTTFGGIPTTSTSVLFIIDVSGSMSDLVIEKDKFDADYPDYQKLTIVKTELQRTIESLDQNTRFNIVSFASDLKLFKRFLVRANVVNRASAVSWVRKLKPIGGSEAQALAGAGLGGTANLAAGKTNTFKALMFPFGVDPDKKRSTGDGGEIKNKIDTVYFLSDGRPSTGKVTDESDIMREVMRLNDKFKIVIHCIAIGEFQRNFLKSLAELNSGVFVDLGH